MTAQDCLEILRSVKDAAFATVDGKGCPQIRIIDVMLVEEEKLYFCTARGKRLLSTADSIRSGGSHSLESGISDGAPFGKGAKADRAEEMDRSDL